jgi:hypothetical protein
VPEEDPPLVEALQGYGVDHAETVVVHPNPFEVLARAAISAPALALASLITATATLVVVSAANDIAEAKFYSARGLDNLAQLRWVAGGRLVVAVLALLLAVLAGFRYSRDLPVTRYTFSPDGEEAVESIEGTEPARWIRYLVGAAAVVAILAIVINGVAVLMTLGLHESPNFGIPNG